MVNTNDPNIGEDAGDASRKTVPLKNAFQTLMAPKPKPPTPSSNADPKEKLNQYYGRAALGAYIQSPSSFPSSRVLSYDDHFVVVRDLFPKSSIHLLILPRDSTKTALHPYDAFEDLQFRDLVLAKVKEVRSLVASELRRLHGTTSAAEALRNAAMDRGDAKLPPGRDWERDVKSGVHAVPSMAHLHVHVLSVDRRSEAMKHRKHYNSFATRFLVPVDEFPLAKDDERRQPGKAGYLNQELTCWRCGKGFGNKFTRLKEHLEEEWDEWRRE